MSMSTFRDIGGIWTDAVKILVLAVILLSCSITLQKLKGAGQRIHENLSMLLIPTVCASAITSKKFN